MDRIERRFAAKDIRFRRVHELGSFQDLPDQEERKVDRNPDIRRDEFVTEKRIEGVEAVEENDDAEEEKGKIRRVGLKGGAEDQRVSVDALRFQGLVELNVRHGDAGPCE